MEEDGDGKRGGGQWRMREGGRGNEKKGRRTGKSMKVAERKGEGEDSERGYRGDKERERERKERGEDARYGGGE